MTQKRFKETISTGIVTDVVTGKEYRCEMRIDEDFLNLVNELEEENEQLKEVLGSILIEVRRDISATNHSGEVKAFVTPNSFDLIVDVLKKYGVLKDWYE